MKMRIRILFALALPACIVSVVARPAQDVETTLPEGAGKTLVVHTCTKCHGLEMFSAARKSGSEWNLILDKMVEEGLEVTDTDAETVINYLTKYLGKNTAPAKINVNKAAAKELEQALGLLDTEAEAIIKYRTAHGVFRDWRELTKVEGVEAGKIEAHKDQIEF